MKNIFRELTLPAFWLLVFVISPGNESRIDQLKKTDNKVPIVIGIKQQDVPSSGATSSNLKNKEKVITRVALLTIN